MKNPFSKLRKNDEGFTLVELIVVIVILAILIGVTVAGVTKYIGQSRKNTDINNASSMSSVLSVLSADEDIYAAAKTATAGTYEVTWGNSSSYTPADLAATNAIQTAVNADPTWSAKIKALIPDGLPKSQTGDGFKLSVTVTADKDVTIKVIALCDTD